MSRRRALQGPKPATTLSLLGPRDARHAGEQAQGAQRAARDTGGLSDADGRSATTHASILQLARHPRHRPRLFKQPALALPRRSQQYRRPRLRKLEFGCREGRSTRTTRFDAATWQAEPSLADETGARRGPRQRRRFIQLGRHDDPGLGEGRCYAGVSKRRLRRRRRGFEAVRTPLATTPTRRASRWSAIATSPTLPLAICTACSACAAHHAARRPGGVGHARRRGWAVSVFRRLLRVQPMSHRPAAAARTRRAATWQQQ